MEKSNEVLGILTALGAVMSPFAYKIIKSKELREKLSNSTTKILRRMANTTNLRHYLFSNLAFYKATINDIEFEECDIKTGLFKAVLNVNTETMITVVEEWLKVNNSTVNSMDKLVLRGELLSLLINIDKLIEIELEDAFFHILESKDKAKEAVGIIYFGDGIHIGFKEYRKKALNSIKKYIVATPMYVNSPNSLIVYHFLGLIDSFLLTSIQDAQEIFECINGKLCKL
jgi:hypothetical protein